MIGPFTRFFRNEKQTSFGQRLLSDLRRVSTREEFLRASDDVIWYPKSVPPNDNGSEPYIIGLRNAVFYPHTSLRTEQGKSGSAGKGDLPKGLTRKTLGLVLSENGVLLQDSFGKSRSVPETATLTADGRWTFELPNGAKALTGTHLFAELFYGHFGHTLTDMPSRLWPVGSRVLNAEDVDGVIGAPNMGAGQRPTNLPDPAKTLLKGIGLPIDLIRFAREPVKIERLILPCRLAPYAAPWNNVIGDMMRRAGEEISSGINPSASSGKVWLSRSRLKSDARGGPGLAALDTLFEARGYKVFHPQEHDFATQVATLKEASHVAGPVGSQLHLSAFIGRPGCKVLSIGPSYFKLDINQKFISGIGGHETHFLIDLPHPGPRKHKAAWSFDPDETQRLISILDTFEEI